MSKIKCVVCLSLQGKTKEAAKLGKKFCPHHTRMMIEAEKRIAKNPGLAENTMKGIKDDADKRVH